MEFFSSLVSLLVNIFEWEIDYINLKALVLLICQVKSQINLANIVHNAVDSFLQSPSQNNSFVLFIYLDVLYLFPCQKSQYFHRSWFITHKVNKKGVIHLKKTLNNL